MSHSKFPLAVCLTHHNVYVSVLFFQVVPPSPSSAVFKVCSLRLCLHCLVNRFISTIFLDSTNIHICFSLSDLLYSVFIHLTRTDSNDSLLWLSDIPQCIRTTASSSIHLSMDIGAAFMPYYSKYCWHGH